jgi:hypothetical protein
VADALPTARQVVLEQCGHVPQVEHPVDANALVHDFIGRAKGSATERAAKRLSRAARRLQGRINGNAATNGAGHEGRDSEIAADAA